MVIKPNISQELALKALEKNTKNKALIVLPTGSGKTYLSAMDAKRRNAKKVLYIAHRNEILEQSRLVFEEVYGQKLSTGIVNSWHKEFEKDFVFATIQTLFSKKNYLRIKQIKFDYIVVDEFHHSATRSWETVIKNLNFKFLLAMTATPFRTDDRNIKKFVDNNVPFEMYLKEGIDKKVVNKFVYFGIHDNTDYSMIEHKGIQYNEKDLDKTLVVPSRDMAILKEYKRMCKGRQALGFCVSIRHVKRITKFFNEHGVRALGLHYRIDYRKRKYLINAFKNKEYDIIFTRDVFNEGIDIPNVESVLFLRPTFSEVVFFQQLGRGLRKIAGKKDVIVLDFIGNYNGAWKKIKWLTKLGLRITKRNMKDELLLNKKFDVYFDKKVVDIFDIQQRRYVSKEDLIKNYYQVKKKLGHSPNSRQVGLHSPYSREKYETVFGSWLNFKKEMGEEILYQHSLPSKGELTSNYFDLKRKFKVVKSYHIKLKNGSKFGIHSYRKVYGGWTEFLKAIKEPLGKQHPLKNKAEIKKKLRKRFAPFISEKIFKRLMEKK